MRADEHIGALEHAGLVHGRLRFRRPDLFGGSPVDRDRPRCLGAREELRHRDGRRHADGPLGAMLVAMEIAGSATQGVVLEDDAQVWARGALLVAAPEGWLQA